jgi:hypothetical protein
MTALEGNWIAFSQKSHSELLKMTDTSLFCHPQEAQAIFDDGFRTADERQQKKLFEMDLSITTCMRIA